MKTDQPTKAAKRGRKAKDPTAVLTFRVPENSAVDLKPLIDACIKNHLNPTGKADPPPIPPDPELPAATYRTQVKKSTEKEPSLGDLWKEWNKQKST